MLEHRNGLRDAAATKRHSGERRHCITGRGGAAATKTRLRRTTALHYRPGRSCYDQNETPANDGTALPAGKELLLERLGTAIQVREGASLHRACWLRCDARGGCEERRGRRAGASLRSNGHTRLYLTAVRAADLPKNQPAYA